MSVDDQATLAALEDLYRRRYPDFVRTAQAIANGAEEGRDAVQEAFLSAVRRRRQFRGDGPIDAWVWRIVVNAAAKRRRDRDARDDVPELIWTDRDAGAFTEIRAAIGRLPERQRLILFLRYYADLDYDTIAHATGVRTGTVGAELNAARTSLARYLEAVTAHG